MALRRDRGRTCQEPLRPRVGADPDDDADVTELIGFVEQRLDGVGRLLSECALRAEQQRNGCAGERRHLSQSLSAEGSHRLARRSLARRGEPPAIRDSAGESMCPRPRPVIAMNCERKSTISA
jgi:hypothetical protein